MFDDIEAVAGDAGLNQNVAKSALIQHGIASVDDDGRVTMSERQSLRAAHYLRLAG
ncbi:MAG: hypothetical protein KA154_15590 [Gemmatimonadaceae bacterium]|nr:hypothetical protein [Gemmatimonadaceae bacterium]